MKNEPLRVLFAVILGGKKANQLFPFDPYQRANAVIRTPGLPCLSEHQWRRLCTSRHRTNRKRWRLITGPGSCKAVGGESTRRYVIVTRPAVLRWQSRLMTTTGLATWLELDYKPGPASVSGRLSPPVIGERRGVEGFDKESALAGWAGYIVNPEVPTHLCRETLQDEATKEPPLGRRGNHCPRYP